MCIRDSVGLRFSSSAAHLGQVDHDVVVLGDRPAVPVRLLGQLLLLHLRAGCPAIDQDCQMSTGLT
eukprot:3810988-Alexandrium_andersonii.AAC.1